LVHAIRGVEIQPHSNQGFNRPYELYFLGDDQKSGARASTDELCECVWHCLAIMRDQDPTGALSHGQNLQIRKTRQSGRRCGLKVNLWLATHNTPDDIFVEVSVRLEANFTGLDDS
jgi:hypothetical protein